MTLPRKPEENSSTSVGSTTSTEPSPKTLDRSNAIDQIAGALAKAQFAIGSITYDKIVNAGPYKYKYASLAAIRSAIKKPMADNDLSLIQQIHGTSLNTQLMHKSGQFISSDMPLRPFTSKPGAQGFGGALTYARRYAISAMLCLAADEDNDANESNVTITSTKKR